MKNLKILSALFLLLSTLTYSQIDTIYFNSSWKKSNKNEAAFYRIVTPLKKLYKFEDYYISGKIQMQGNSVFKDSLYKVGKFIFSNEDGTYDRITSFKNNIENGEYQLFYSTNTIKEIGNYKNGLLFGKNSQYFENGIIKRISYFKKGRYDGEMIYFNEKGIRIGQGQTKDDGWFGKWKKYDDNGLFLNFLYYQDYFNIKESRITINTPNTIWTYFPREENEHNYSYFCTETYNKIKPKTLSNDSPEIYIVIPKESENSSINNLKIEDKDKYKYSLNIKDPNIKISEIFLTKTISKNNDENSNIYIDILSKNKTMIIKVVVLSDKLDYYEPTIEEFISNLKVY